MPMQFFLYDMKIIISGSLTTAVLMQDRCRMDEGISMTATTVCTVSPAEKECRMTAGGEAISVRTVKVQLDACG